MTLEERDKPRSVWVGLEKVLTGIWYWMSGGPLTHGYYRSIMRINVILSGLLADTESDMEAGIERFGKEVREVREHFLVRCVDLAFPILGCVLAFIIGATIPSLAKSYPRAGILLILTGVFMPAFQVLLATTTMHVLLHRKIKRVPQKIRDQLNEWAA